MIEIIIISLAISAYLILDDIVFTATLKSNTPCTSQQLYLDCDTDYDYLGDPDMDFEEYCNWRMNRK
jgi:hypothetical protein